MKTVLKFLFNGFLAVCIFILFQFTKVLAMHGSGSAAFGVGIIGLLVIVLIGWLAGKFLFQTTNELQKEEITKNANKTKSQNSKQSWWDDITKPQTPLVEGNKSKAEIRKNKIGYEIVDQDEDIVSIDTVKDFNGMKISMGTLKDGSGHVVVFNEKIKKWVKSESVDMDDVLRSPPWIEDEAK